MAAKLDPKSIEVKRVIGLAVRSVRTSPGPSRSFRVWLTTCPPMLGPQPVVPRPGRPERRRQTEKGAGTCRAKRQAKRQRRGALATLGTVYYRLNRLDQAEKVLQAVVVSGKANSDVAYVLAHVKAARGQPDAAGPLLKMAVKAPGFFIGRKDAQEWLDRLTATAK